MRSARSIAVHLVAAFALFLLASFTLAQIHPESSPSTAPVRFTSVDVMVDPHGTPLAAYQLEFFADPARVKLVGIEGGQHKAFKEPPYYDPRALNGNRVILGALNTGSDLPSQQTRVARLHLRIVGSEQPRFSAKMMVAASSNDKTLKADVSISEGAAQ